MKKQLLSIGSLVVAVTLSSCGTSYQSGLSQNTQNKALIGGALGGLAGSVIGHQSGRGREGALLGAALGAAGGYVVGQNEDVNRGGYQPQPQPHQGQPQYYPNYK